MGSYATKCPRRDALSAQPLNAATPKRSRRANQRLRLPWQLRPPWHVPLSLSPNKERKGGQPFPYSANASLQFAADSQYLGDRRRRAPHLWLVWLRGRGSGGRPAYVGMPRSSSGDVPHHGRRRMATCGGRFYPFIRGPSFRRRSRLQDKYEACRTFQPAHYSRVAGDVRGRIAPYLFVEFGCTRYVRCRATLQHVCLTTASAAAGARKLRRPVQRHATLNQI